MTTPEILLIISIWYVPLPSVDCYVGKAVNLYGNVICPLNTETEIGFDMLYANEYLRTSIIALLEYWLGLDYSRGEFNSILKN